MNCVSHRTFFISLAYIFFECFSDSLIAHFKKNRFESQASVFHPFGDRRTQPTELEKKLLIFDL